MADVKWIKLSTDIFDNRKIRQIESMPEGDAIVVIWLKLLILAGSINDGGSVYFTKDIPYTEELLATQFGRPIQIVRLALSTFQAFGMIEIFDNLILVSNWEKYQNTESLDRIREQNRIRKRNERERKRLMLSDGHDSSRDSHEPDKDVEEEKDIEQEKNEGANIKREDSDERKTAVQKPEDKAVFEIPLIDGTMYGVTRSEINLYKSLYPAVDVEQQIRAIIGWNMVNPKRRKTRNGIKRHINTWLADKQDKGRGVYNKNSSGYIPVPASIPSDDDDENPFKR